MGRQADLSQTYRDVRSINPSKDRGWHLLRFGGFDYFSQVIRSANLIFMDSLFLQWPMCFFWSRASVYYNNTTANVSVRIQGEQKHAQSTTVNSDVIFLTAILLCSVLFYSLLFLSQKMISCKHLPELDLLCTSQPYFREKARPCTPVPGGCCQWASPTPSLSVQHRK